MAEQRTSPVTITDLAEARTRATNAAVQQALTAYRMAGFPRPFRGGGDRFHHLFVPGTNLSLCDGLAVVHPDRLRPAFLDEIDCVTCLDRFTEWTRP